jgi:hypothetical protein
VTTAPSRHERPARDRDEASERLRAADALIAQLPQFDPVRAMRRRQGADDE